MTKITVTILFTFFSLVALSQNDYPAEPAEVEKRLFKINFFAPAIEYEIKVGQTNTFNIHPGLGFSFSYYTSTYGGSDFNYVVAPFIDIQYRYYYNFEKRRFLKKHIAGNSGNFIALKVLATGRSIADNLNGLIGSSVGVGPIWGLQRTYYNNFNLTLSLGLGYFTNEFGEGDISSMGDFTLGYVIKPKKSAASMNLR